jgi:hypothetical protein
MILACVLLAGCRFPGDALNAETRAKMKTVYDEAMIEREPLCVDAVKFPFRGGGSERCDKCQALEQAGALERRIEGESVTYSLTEAGRPLYRFEPDAEYVELVRKRFERQHMDREVDEKMLSRPRICFGRTRFHHIDETLAPMRLGGNEYISVKLVAEAQDTSGLLRDPRLSALGIPLPPAPAEPGAPLLYPPRVTTFEFVNGDPLPSLSDMRYGAWVDAD